MSTVLGDWVGTWAVWLGLICSVIFIVASFFGAVKWARKQLKDAILDDVTPSLTHIHDCVERMGAEAVVNAKAAVEAAEAAHAEATSAREAIDRHAEVMAGHTAQDAVEFADIAEWRGKVDAALAALNDKLSEGGSSAGFGVAASG